MGDEDQGGQDEYMSSAMVAIKKYVVLLMLRVKSQACTRMTLIVSRATIDKLRKDNLALKEELYLENKFSITPLDTSAAGRITAMQDEADALTRKVLMHCFYSRY